MSNYVASLVSLTNHVNKAKNGNILRHISSFGHGVKVISKLSKGQGPEAATNLAKGIVDTFNKVTDGSAVGQAVKKGVLLTKHTDPIVASCAMIRVAKSDTPARTFLEESIDFVGTCLVEDAMVKYAKDIANIKGIKTLNEKMVNFCKKDKTLSVVPGIVYGTLFVAGSCLGSKAFRAVGTWISDKLGLAKSELPPENHKTPDGKVQYYFG